jgi:flagellar hook-associated protein 1 FlgK
VSGTFSSVNSALSALRYQQVVMDVTSGNVANVGSDGYVRRRVSGEAVGAPAQPAMWSRYDGAGEGVRISGVDRMVDPLLDARARREHGNQSYLDVRQGVLERLESGIGEPGDNGVSAALAEFKKSWADLANNPGREAARNQVLAKAGSLADSIRIQARNVNAEAGDQRVALQTDVGEVNTLASDLAATNKSIAIANINGTDAGTLLDKRDALALRLSELTGAVATPRTDGGFDVAVGGVPLVTGQDAGTFVIATGVTATGGDDGNPVSFSITAPNGTSTSVPGGLRGEIGSEAELLTTTLPAYLAGLNEIAKTLADQVNAQHAQGVDQDGAQGGPLFAYDPADIAGTLAVDPAMVGNPRKVAASSGPAGTPTLDAGNALAMGAAVTVGTDYQRLVTGFGSDVASTRRLALNQQTLTTQVDASREQLSGVNLDEEMVNMLTAQRAYEAAARVMTTVDSVLDTLINRTGMTR